MTLEQQVREFYQEQRLSDAEVDAILAVSATKPRGRWALLAAATGLTAAAAAVLLWVWSPSMLPAPEAPRPEPSQVDPNEPALVPAVAGEPAPVPAVAREREQRPATLAIATEPPGAVVYLDGRVRGTTPLRIDGVEPGVHDVVVEREGKRDLKRVKLAPGGMANIRIRLEATPGVPASPSPVGDCTGKPAKLSVTGKVRGCAVHWGSQRVGVAPLSRKKVPSGICEMVITCPNGSWTSELVRTTPGRHVEEIYGVEDLFNFMSPEDENYQPSPWSSAAGAAKPDTSAKPEIESVVREAERLYGMGYVALKAGRFQEAIDFFERCVAVNPQHALGYRALGITHARAGNGPEAYHWYGEYVRVAPHAGDAGAVRKLLQDYEDTLTGEEE